MAMFDSLPLEARRALCHVEETDAESYMRLVDFIMKTRAISLPQAHQVATEFVMQAYNRETFVRL